MLGSLLSQVFISAALHDGEQTLVVAVERFRLVEALHATLQPALGQPQGVFCILVIALTRGALVEGHHDVGTNDALGVHHVLGGKNMLRTIDMTTELTTLLGEFADTGE